jgi:hypothetical protein
MGTLTTNYLPGNSKYNIQVFQSVNTGTDWQTWYKPKGCSMAYIVCMAGGQGGAGGASGNLGGGGGGAGGGMIALLVPFWNIPDRLYILVGGVAAGGAAGAAGASANLSYVAYFPSSANPTSNVLLNTGGGQTAPTAGGASNGAGGIFNAPALGATTYWGVGSSHAGPSGAAGYAGAGCWSAINGGGAGGGESTGSSGGNITTNVTPPNGWIPANLILAGGTASSTSSPAGNGNQGIRVGSLPVGGFGNTGLSMPLMFTGGSGGGPNSSTGNGGNGANGDIASGGGGGGASASGTGGSGGNGGPGLVIIHCW